MNLVGYVASCPVGWRLFMPASWDPASAEAAVDVGLRRARAQVPDDVGHREKWRLGLDMIDEVIGWGLTPPVIVADAGYGDSGEFRHGLTERGLSYVVRAATTIGVQRQEAARTAPPAAWTGRRPTLRYRNPATSVTDLILSHAAAAAQSVSWRDGSRTRAGRPVTMRSRFVFLRVRPAGRILLAAHRDQDLPEAWLIAEWPPERDEPTNYWLSNPPATTAKRTLIRWAKLRWRIEHDYRELKTGLGLDHYEGRTWQGWHHHVTLVSAAHAFCTLQRLDPQAPAPDRRDRSSAPATGWPAHSACRHADVPKARIRSIGDVQGSNARSPRRGRRPSRHLPAHACGVRWLGLGVRVTSAVSCVRNLQGRAP